MRRPVAEGLAFTKGTPLLHGIGEVLGEWPAVAGCGLVGDQHFNRTQQWFDDRLQSESALALMASGSVRMDTLTLHGLRPMSSYHTITGTDGDAVLTIDGRRWRLRRCGSDARCPSEGGLQEATGGTRRGSEEAQQFNDYERAARAEADIDALVQALASAVGLRGRDRKAASTSERARLNVTRAIKGAIEKIEQNNATLGEHLAVSIKTGTFCSYTPDPGVPTTWVL